MVHDLRFGIITLPNVPWPTLAERWRRIEALGFDSVWNADHYLNPHQPEEPWFEGWTSLAALAACTTRIRVGVLVTCVTFRNPALLAKVALTVDHVSNGRLELGLGAGYSELEHRMMGIRFPPPSERVAHFREVVEIVDALLRNDLTTHRGQHYAVTEALMRPAPIQRPRPPLTLAGKGPRMLEVIAAYADTWNSSGSPGEMRARSAFLDEQCAVASRDPGRIRRSLLFSRSVDPEYAGIWESPDRFQEVVGRYREAGVSEFIFYWPRPGPDETRLVRGLERIASDVLPTLRASVREVCAGL